MVGDEFSSVGLNKFLDICVCVPGAEWYGCGRWAPSLICNWHCGDCVVFARVVLEVLVLLTGDIKGGDVVACWVDPLPVCWVVSSGALSPLPPALFLLSGSGLLLFRCAGLRFRCRVVRFTLGVRRPTKRVQLNFSAIHVQPTNLVTRPASGGSVQPGETMANQKSAPQLSGHTHATHDKLKT